MSPAMFSLEPETACVTGITRALHGDRNTLRSLLSEADEVMARDKAFVLRCGLGNAPPRASMPGSQAAQRSRGPETRASEAAPTPRWKRPMPRKRLAAVRRGRTHCP